jgi:hypothetical protein
VKKVLRFLFIAIIGIVLALLILPYVFKDRIFELIKQGMNEQLNAQVDFKDVDLSFIKSFPQARVTIYDLKIQGIDDFEEITLLNSKTVYVETSLIPIFNKSVKPSISYVSFDQPKLHVVRLNDSLANYLIMKPSSDTSTFSLSLNGYDIKNGILIYEDNLLALRVNAEQVNHSGSGNLSTNVYDLKTLTDAKIFTMEYEGFKYLNKVTANLDALINVDLLNEKYTFDNANLLLNKLKVEGSGNVDFEGDDMIVVGDFESVGSKFEDFVSTLPFIAQDQTYKADGKANISLKVNGLYNSLKPAYPAFSLNTTIDKGSIKYSELPYPINNIAAEIKISSTKSKLEDLRINIPKFALAVNNETIKGDLQIDKSLSNPIVKGNLLGTINLDNWKKTMPLVDVEQLSGKIVSDISFDAALADVESKNYEKIKFEGDFKGNGLKYKVKNSPSLEAGSLNVVASPREFGFDANQVKYGKSDFAIGGKINNPLAVFSNKTGINGKINLTSNLLDLNELSQSPSKSDQTQATSFDIRQYSSSEVDADINIKKVLYDKHVINDLNIKGKAGINAMDIETMEAKINESDIKVSGRLVNAWDYLMNAGKLQGDINLTSKFLNLNDYLSTDNSPTSKAPKGVIPIPANVDLKINSEIEKLNYSNLSLNSVSGQLTVLDSEAKLENLVMGIFGGKINLDGMYGTKNINEPAYRVKLNFDKLRMEDAYLNFVTLKSLAPVTQLIKGYFNTTLVMEGSMGSDMTPNFPSLNAQGFIETINSGLAQFKVLTELGEKLGVEQISKINIAESRNWFDIKNGYVELKEKVFENKGIGFKVSGKHQIMGPMEYLMMVKVPRALIKNSKIGNTADKGLTWVINEAKRKGIDIEQGDYIDFRVDISGKLTLPVLKITPVGSSGESITKEVENEIKAEIKKTTDSLITVINDKKTKIEDSVRTRLEQELEAAKKKAMDEAEKKAREAANTVKTEVKKEIESRIDSAFSGAVKDTVLKKAEEILKSKTGTQVDDIKKKIEDFNPFKKKKSGG